MNTIFGIKATNPVQISQSAFCFTTKMLKHSLIVLVSLIIVGDVLGCLITNCPRGGKRSGNLETNNIKPCISCGPGRTGQCFGPSICCGPFGCLLGTPETLKCQRDGFFHEREPCIAGSSSCRKNSGRCAADGICCNQDSCHSDKQCSMEEKAKLLPDNALDFYNLMNYAPLELNLNDK